MIVIYSAISIDGYIARKDGSIDWLHGFDASKEDYEKFISGVDGLIMGRATYDQVLRSGVWPYTGKPAFVFTRSRPDKAPEDVEFVSGAPQTVLRGIARRGFENIWLVGGADLTRPFLENRLIDELNIFIMPVLLGDGIPLFPKNASEQRLQLMQIEKLDGDCARVTYRRTGALQDKPSGRGAQRRQERGGTC